MAVAYDKGKRVMSEMLNDAESWRADDWGGCKIFLDGIVAASRFCYRRGMFRIDHLNRIPYIFSRLDEPAFCVEAITQYDSAPKSMHNRISVEVCDPSGLRADVAQGATGAPLSLQLDRVRMRFKTMNLNDKIGEGPHSVLNNIGNHSNASTFPWDSSTMRTPQNLDFYDRMFDGSEAVFENMWARVGTLVQTRPRDRPVRLKWKELINKVYFFRLDLDKKPEAIAAVAVGFPKKTLLRLLPHTQTVNMIMKAY